MSDGAVVPLLTPRYRRNDDPNEWWCKSHNRMATHLHRRDDGTERPCCEPGLGGILLPCACEQLVCSDAAEEKPNIGAIKNILQALEGMQAQVQTLTDLVVEQDKRIEKLERRKIIRGIGS